MHHNRRYPNRRRRRCSNYFNGCGIVGYNICLVRGVGVSCLVIVALTLVQIFGRIYGQHINSSYYTSSWLLSSCCRESLTPITYAAATHARLPFINKRIDVKVFLGHSTCMMQPISPSDIIAIFVATAQPPRSISSY